MTCLIQFLPLPWHSLGPPDRYNRLSVAGRLNCLAICNKPSNALNWYCNGFWCIENQYCSQDLSPCTVVLGPCFIYSLEPIWVLSDRINSWICFYWSFTALVACSLIKFTYAVPWILHGTAIYAVSWRFYSVNKSSKFGRSRFQRTFPEIVLAKSSGAKDFGTFAILSN